MNANSVENYSKFINQKYGKLTILKLIYDETSSGRNRYQYKCKCDCGNIANIPCWYILEREQKSCGCLKYKTKIDYTQNIGKRFGNLIIQDLVRTKRNNDTQNKLYYICNCDCGTKNKYIQVHLFHKYNYTSCGCKQVKTCIKDCQSYVGTQINDLTVIEYKYNQSAVNKRNKHMFRCKCTCGNENYWITKEQLLYKTPQRCDSCYTWKSLNSQNNLLEYCKSINIELLNQFTAKANSFEKDNGKISTVYNDYNFRCSICNNEFVKKLSPCSLLICPFCNNSFKTNTEKILYNFFSEYNIFPQKTMIKSKNQKLQKNIEIDLYIPEYQLGIELHGLITHATTSNIYDNYFVGSKPKNYHLNKLESCKEQNIKLIQFWNSEVLQKTDIVKSIILNRINKSPYCEYARNCYIKEIDKKTYDQFMNNHHIQGSTNGESVRIGLFYKGNNNLVSCMSFGRARYSLHEWELFRFANHVYCIVIGGATKLFKYFINNYNPNDIVSHSDRRLFNDGKLYNILGFKLSHNSNINYWYFKRYHYEQNVKLYHRSTFQKHLLFDKLDHFDPNLSETQNMENNEYLRIYDCGNKVYQWYR